MPELPEPEELLAIAVRVARDAAETARRMRTEAITDVDTKSTATDVVTAADLAVERQVVAVLRELRPQDSILGEEYGVTGASSRDGAPDPAEDDRYADGGSAGSGSGSAGSADAHLRQDGRAGPAGARSGPGGDVRWLLDPIDGTVNYLYGLPNYAVSLAAEVDGVIVAGVVRNPATGDEWTAVRGRGAYRAGRRLRGPGTTLLSQALVGTGFGYDAARRAHQAAVLARLLPEVRDIRRFGAAALDLCLAAEGALDAFYEKGLNPWDHAAGGLVAEEAGLRVAGLHGAPSGRDMVIAAPPALFGPLHDRLAQLDAAGGP